MTGSLTPWDEIEVKQRQLHAELSRLHLPTSEDLDWASETLTRLEAKRRTAGLTDQDWTDLERAREILDRMQDNFSGFNPGQPRDENGKWTRGFDVDRAAATIQKNDSATCTKGCATRTREAIEQGLGVEIVPADRPPGDPRVSAKDYGKTIQKYGFDPVATAKADAGYPPMEDGDPAKEYVAQKGDVAIIQPVPGHSDGHMELYDGDRWMPDYGQINDNNPKGFWPHQDYYRDETPPYVVYRHRKPVRSRVTI